MRSQNDYSADIDQIPRLPEHTLRSPVTTLAGILAFLMVGAPTVSAERLPSIVIILADDLGYGDVKVYNPQSKIATPNIDRLAQQGIRFTDAHAAATCIPSRYELLTGRYLFRNPSVARALIDPGQTTLAGLLKNAGYTTAMLGKWHLGFEGLGVHPTAFNYNVPLRGGPVDHGFDSYFGVHASLDVAPYGYIRNNRFADASTMTVIKGNHTPGVRSIQGAFWRGGTVAGGFKHKDVLDRISSEAVKYLESRAHSAQPFFLYLALTAPHSPWLPDDTFRGESGAGMYGDFVTQMDAVVGRVIAALDSSGKGNDALVIFTSDNGPAWYLSDVEKYGHRAVGPLRGMKGDPWEGGHRIPFIARWPGKIAQGTSTPELLSFTDMLATLASLTGQTLTKEEGQNSLDMLPALLGVSSQPIRNVIVHEAMGPDGMLLAVREGGWKLIPSSCDTSMFEGFGDGGEFSNPCLQEAQHSGPQGQLYNIYNDPREQDNVYAKHPKMVKELTELLGTYLKTVSVQSSSLGKD